MQKRPPRVEIQAQAACQEKVNHWKKENRPLVYLDESGFAHDMPRPYGYAVKGRRCEGVHNWQAKGRINIIGAQMGEGLLASCLMQGNVDSGVFHAWGHPGTAATSARGSGHHPGQRYLPQTR